MNPHDSHIHFTSGKGTGSERRAGLRTAVVKSKAAASRSRAGAEVPMHR